MTPTLIAAALAFAAIASVSAAHAGAKDYEFQPVAVDVKNASGAELAVRLLHKPTGRPVEGAVLLRTRLDMSPDGMGAMTAKHAAMPAAEPGVYRFKADLTMAGQWALQLQAKVQGEAETVERTVIFNALD